ncbi:hypothetical protein J2S78_000296 [Salibacterium salarium]|uniref:Uncharacterized protein n=1 Tax=Salibacterium salarium TaxID=284579 RepID=A0A3R9PJ49_9BACI|nr:hypothetical protein [Salibacterium salarium]MDQ0297888.1 hypothetical protein [Salibacterium salarium]RSL31861.1 hypothetical protein D7Z54_18880 [Salibacterium salarium]
MKTFVVIYYLEQDFKINRLIEAESQEEAVKKIQEDGDLISFTNSKGIYHELKRSDVKLIQMGLAKKQNAAQQQNVN